MVKRIELTQGQYALVDDVDFEFLNQWDWKAQYNRGIDNYYARRTEYLGKKKGKTKLKTILMHRIVLNAPGNLMVDHINHNTLDNRKINLRLVTARQNQQNRKQNTSSNYPGVSWETRTKKWLSCIKINGRNKNLGRFADEREAAKAYERACRELVGEELVCKAKGGVV